MLDWSTKRKLQYFAIIVGFILLFFVVPFYAFIYRPPSCFDGLKNGLEKGIDCGGACRLICSAEAITPILRWDPRVFSVSPESYSVLAYVENPNIAAEVLSAPYTFKIYDKDGSLITERRGTTFIPRNKTFAIFDGNFTAGDRVPFRATFEFGKLVWTRNTAEEPEISVVNTALMNEDTVPRVEATVENKTLERVSNIELVSIIYDGSDNAIAASRTFLESLERGETAPIVFTWPQKFSTKSEVCSLPVDVALVIDRSGSMDDLGANPPQPLTDVKNAAIFFINQLNLADQGALVTFANSASQPTDFSLGGDFEGLKNAISNIQILSGEIQNTNIADGIAKAREELNSLNHKESSNKVMILLTDGVATLPADRNNPNYPEDSALEIANQSRSESISIFTIGLGDKLNAEFLKSIASNPEEFYSAPTTNELSGIYNQIATKICDKRPARIEVIERFYPSPNFQ